MLGGWTRAGCPAAARVVVSDCDAAALDRLKSEFPSVTVSQDNRQVASQDVVMFALHPPAFPGVLSEITQSLRRDAMFVSLAPKWTTARLSQSLGGFDRIARLIPNAPSIVNKGFNPVWYSPALSDLDRQRLRGLFAPLGECPEVREETLEAYAIVAAMGPTYLWYQLYQLIELGCGFGLGREDAAAAVAAMVDGASATMGLSGLTPEGVMDLIPVKPLAGIEETVRQAYVGTLTALHQKLTS
jgi:pyrroline-5-carboxylate reductase